MSWHCCFATLQSKQRLTISLVLMVSIMRAGLWMTSTNGSKLWHRMDRIYLESGDGLFEDQQRLQKLLRRADVGATTGDGAGELYQRIQSHIATAHA